MIIFNLDGTLANCEHRMHFIQPYEKKWINEVNYLDEKIPCFGLQYLKKDGTLFQEQDWKSFYEACDKDSVIIPVIETFSRYWIGEKPRHVEIWSARCESVKEKTVEWFLCNWFLGLFEHEINIFRKIIKLRPIGDYTPEHELKEKWLDEALTEGKKIDFVFESDPESIDMWRRKGIFVFNCSQNDEDF